MAKTQLRGTQVLDRSIQLDDIDTTTPGQCLVTKIVAGAGISLQCSGADTGTGEVTVTSDASADYEYRQKMECLLWMGM